MLQEVGNPSSFNLDLIAVSLVFGGNPRSWATVWAYILNFPYGPDVAGVVVGVVVGVSTGVGVGVCGTISCHSGGSVVGVVGGSVVGVVGGSVVGVVGVCAVVALPIFWSMLTR